ncbi:MAG: hypothetical protein KGJ86_01350 [Chloroflexota bacterium]|nr:hypothetical protein [Chloroflexota bacterium]
MSALNVAFVWHMHQPYYRNQLTGEYMLPWVLLHGTKDYLHMVQVLEDFPAIHQTFNLVPSLMQQLADYASGEAVDECLRISRTPVSELTGQDRRYVLQFFFSINYEKVISRYPGYQAVYQMREAALADPERMPEQFWRDTIGWFNLAWIDMATVRSDPVLRRLARQEHFSRGDIDLIRDKQLELLRAILPTYRRLRDRGQIELSTSPYYHPILPLLVDNHRAAGEANPHVRLPFRQFRHPEDAVEQIRRAKVLHRELLGEAPVGAWPSEGSVSQSVIYPLAQAGIRWIATDEEILNRSQGFSLRHADGTPYDPAALYSAYEVEDSGYRLAVLFRDRSMADLIGFKYQAWRPTDAVEDLLLRLHRIRQALGKHAPEHVVPLILDGENCWEFYDNNGQDFLEGLYGELTADPDLRCVTVSEFLAEHPPARTLPHLASGSWIGGTFDVWIGEQAQNVAWDFLTRTREDLVRWETELEGADIGVLERAWDEIYVAEGSDWFWWYYSGNEPKLERGFDRQFRTHLANVYKLMGSPIPAYLNEPILRE